MTHHIIKNLVTTQNPTLRLFDGLSGVHNLNPNLTINGTTAVPILRYKGGDAGASTWNAWGYGTQLTLQAGTAPTYNVGSPLLGGLDDSVLLNSGGYYQAGDTTSGDIATEDFVIEIVFTIPSGTKRIASKRKDGAGSCFDISNNAANSVGSYIRDGTSGLATNTVSAALTTGAWYHGILFGNRDENTANGSQWYINGVASGAGINISTVSTLTNTAPFQIGTYGGFASTLGDSNVSYIAVWTQASWHQAGAAGPAEWATVAKDRFSRLVGIYPSKSTGTAVPTTITRATTAYLDKTTSGVRKLYQVGAGWPRVCSINDSASKQVNGYLSERAATNICLQSENLSASWLKRAADSYSLNSIAAPNGTLTADGFIADGISQTHYVYQTITHAVNRYTWSIFAKPGNKDWIILRNDANLESASFDITNGLVSAVSVGCTGVIENYGNGWYRCSFTYTSYSVSDPLPSVYISGSNGVVAYAGDGATVNTYLWGSQIELGNVASSYIPTTTGSATRNADVLTYKADDGNVVDSIGTMGASILVPNQEFGVDGYIASLSDGADPSKAISLYINSNDNPTLFTLSSISADGYVVGTTDVTAGALARLSGVWNTNYARLYANGISSSFIWYEQSNPKNVSLYDITYGNSLYVAVGSVDGVDAYIVTSPDGLVWTEQANPKNFTLPGVTYGNGLFVAVGDPDGVDSYIITSTNGTSWTEQANPKNFLLYSVTYGNGLFVAVGAADGTDSYLVTSANGTLWTEQANPKNFLLYKVVYGKSLFVAVGAADGVDAYIITSSNGTSWSEQANPKNFNLIDIAYGNNLFVAVGSPDGTDSYIVTSTNGTSWTERANPKNFSLQGITYADGLFVAVGDTDGGDAYIVTSPDGITWTERVNPKPFKLQAVVCNNSRFVAVGNADGTDAYIISSNGTDTSAVIPTNLDQLNIGSNIAGGGQLGGLISNLKVYKKKVLR